MKKSKPRDGSGSVDAEARAEPSAVLVLERHSALAFVVRGAARPFHDDLLGNVLRKLLAHVVSYHHASFQELSLRESDLDRFTIAPESHTA
ncbi:MAG: hypothetical protein ABI895_39070, partial [Deltaproteobacteria bacterium]